MLNIPIEVQDALREGALRKNYKMKVNDVDPDTGERTYLYTIDNDTLVSESVKIDERMVTGKVLKFGLCEGSSLEFQYFDHPNINGKDVQVYCSVEYVDGNGDVAWYDIPMGWYTVDQCPMQWETGIYKVTAYNKLKSKYLDAKANSLIEEAVAEGEEGKPADTISLRTMLDRLLNDYYIEVNPNIDKSFSFQYGDTAYNANCYTRLNGQYKNSGYYLKVLYIAKDIVVDGGFQSDSYYKVIMNPKVIDEYFENIRKNLIRNINDSLRNYYDGYLEPDQSTTYYGTYYDLYSSKRHECLWKNQNPTFSILEHRNDELYDSGWITGLSGSYALRFDFPLIYTEKTTYDSIVTNVEKDLMDAAFEELEPYLLQHISIIERNLSDIEKKSFSLQDVSSWSDVTLRELQSATFETVCQYGQLDRETDLFTGVELNQGGLYPADTLYPDNALYPQGTMEHPFPSTYSKLWTDTVGEQSFRYLIITYKAMENGQEVEKTLQRTVNADGTTNYNMSDNWLFRNLVWTAEDVGAYADAMVLKMKDIRWFPFEMWCAGLPYVETGDAIEITDRQGNTHTSYVLTRTLDGIHNLQDTFINGELDIF